MPFFNWLCLDKSGKAVAGKTFCSSLENAKSELGKQGLSVVSIAEQKISFKFFARKTNLEDKVNFFVELYQLLESGLLLPRALLILSNSNAHLEEVVTQLYMQVEEGAAFSEALKTFPKIFSDYEVCMVLAGQESGDLKTALASIAKSLESKRAFGAKLKSLLLLPVVTLIFFVLISLIIFLYIIPSFASMFADNGVDGAGLVFKVSLFLNSFGIKKILTFSVALFVMFYILLKSKVGRNCKSFVAYKFPLLNKVTLFINLSYFLDALGFMLKSGVKIDAALETCQNVVNNSYIKKEFSKLSNLVKEGFSLEQAMASSNIFPLELLAMVSVGQESGALTVMICRAANIYQKKSSKMIGTFLNLLQPLLMLLLGVLVTTLLFSVYLPIFDLASNIKV